MRSCLQKRLLGNGLIHHSFTSIQCLLTANVSCKHMAFMEGCRWLAPKVPKQKANSMGKHELIQKPTKTEVLNGSTDRSCCMDGEAMGAKRRHLCEDIVL